MVTLFAQYPTVPLIPPSLFLAPRMRTHIRAHILHKLSHLDGSICVQFMAARIFKSRCPRPRTFVV